MSRAAKFGQRNFPTKNQRKYIPPEGCSRRYWGCFSAKNSTFAVHGSRETHPTHPQQQQARSTDEYPKFCLPINKKGQPEGGRSQRALIFQISRKRSDRGGIRKTEARKTAASAPVFLALGFRGIVETGTEVAPFSQQ